MVDSKKVIVLLSGGIDSVTALYYARREYSVVSAVSFDYGSKHNHREIPFAEYHCHNLKIDHKIVEIDFINQYFESHLLQSGDDIPEGKYDEENLKKTVVPFRNGIMLAIAAGLAESHGFRGLVIAAHTGDHAIYPDCREDFMISMGEAIKKGTMAGIDLIRPFISMSKADIIRRGGELEIDFSRTWSCYVGGTTHCGRCGTCLERREAFVAAKMVDPTEYEDGS